MDELEGWTRVFENVNIVLVGPVIGGTLPHHQWSIHDTEGVQTIGADHLSCVAMGQPIWFSATIDKTTDTTGGYRIPLSGIDLAHTCGCRCTGVARLQRNCYQWWQIGRRYAKLGTYCLDKQTWITWCRKVDWEWWPICCSKWCFHCLTWGELPPFSTSSITIFHTLSDTIS